MIYTAIDNFYVSEEQLENTPSRKDGLSMEVETQLRIYGCEVIQEGGILLKLPQAVMATAQVLLQRLYMKKSLRKFNIKRVAWTCCWLATKLEENPRRIRDVLSVFYRVDKRREGKPLQCLDVYGQEYANFKKELVDVERHLLREFGFILHVDHPHKFVLNYLNLLKAGPELKQEAWNLCNDSLRTTLSVRFRGETVACGIIFLASKRLQEPLPDDPAWWELFKISKEDMYTVARQVHALFSMPKVQYISVYRTTKLQESKDSVTAAILSSSVTPTTTPPHDEPDSEGGQSQEVSKEPDKAVAPVGAGPLIDRAPDSSRKEKRKRSKHDRPREEDDDGERRRRYRKKDDYSDGDSETKEERGSKRDRDIDWKKDKRLKEAARDKEKERSKRDRSREREKDYRERRREGKS